MSLERQIPDHILSHRLAQCTMDSAVGQPLIGATWVGKYPRVCQWHARTRRWADTWRQGTPWVGRPPHPFTPPTHSHTHMQTHLHMPPPTATSPPSFLPLPLALSCPLETTPCSWYWVGGHYLCQRSSLAHMLQMVCVSVCLSIC